MTDLTVADVLDRAADLLTPEGAWTQGAFGRDANGEPCGLSQLERAVCYCLVGATDAAASDDLNLSCAADDALSALLGERSVSTWNDAPERTQAEVVAKLREAADLARTGAAS